MVKKNEVLNISENTQNCFAYILATKYRSEAVLYSKRTVGHPLSSHINTIAVAILQAEIKPQKSCILNILKKHPTLGVWCTPLKIFRVLQTISRILQVPIFRNNFHFG